MNECPTEYTLQAYFDGELLAPQMQGVAAHFTICDRCAVLSQEIAEEIDLLSFALAPELELPVPSAKLRARMDIALANLDTVGQAPVRLSLAERLSAWFAGLSLTPQFAFAGGTLVVLLSGLIYLATPSNDQLVGNVINLASLNRSEFILNQNELIARRPSPTPIIVKSGKTAVTSPEFKLVKYSAPGLEPKVRPQRSPVGQRQHNATPLPGEANYLTTIASLERAVAAQQSAYETQPKLRTVYERNVALLDQAILASQRAARRNPKDPDAVEFLYTSYQNKVELMNTFATSIRPTIAER